MKKFAILMVLLAGTQAFAREGGGSSIGPISPASVNCIWLGGDLETVTTPSGFYANCVIEEWKLFQEMNDRNLVRPHTYPPGAVPNPASVNCADSGGKLRIVHALEGQLGMCVIKALALYKVINITGMP